MIKFKLVVLKFVVLVFKTRLSLLSITSTLVLIESSFCLDLGNLPLKEKNNIKKSLTDRGGIVHSTLTQKTLVLLCSYDQIQAGSFKVRSARLQNKAVVTIDYINSCVNRKRPIDKYTLMLDGKFEHVPEEIKQELNQKAKSILSTFNLVATDIAGLAAAPLSDDQASRMKKTINLPHFLVRYYKALPDPVRKDDTGSLYKFKGDFSMQKLRERHEREAHQRLEQETQRRLEEADQQKRNQSEREAQSAKTRAQRDAEMKLSKEEAERRRIQRIEKEKMDKIMAEEAEYDFALRILKNLKDSQKKPDPPIIASQWLVLDDSCLRSYKIQMAEEAVKLYKDIIDPELLEQLNEHQVSTGKVVVKPNKEVTVPITFLEKMKQSLGLMPDEIEEEDDD
eukprot:TRINITY_DN1788_c1_g2_i1.p1 TRINITY_DN1788_c1_g2~~TRINITY_DN1788_c1_g2_i1.p1  ORF type:complete len:395 (-),score=102.42 TRINITY_DN1788_c1_g2_i1:892-2076(-)